MNSKHVFKLNTIGIIIETNNKHYIYYQAVWQLNTLLVLYITGQYNTIDDQTVLGVFALFRNF